MSDDLPPDAPEPPEPDDAREVSEPLRRAIGERYLSYALSTIMNRALPDARDGLKPVHRRILFAMRELRLSPTGGFRKSAKIVGDVMGNYHPHGDSAIYDAMVRLAQDFAMRYPLVGGQGNFGNIDGDAAAASRYTEARMAAAAEALLAGLDEDAVDFRPNYDGTLQEPVVLPGAFPNLLANGASGIAVGMATNIPPHNLGELIAACLHLLRDPDADNAALMAHVPGPDFPTGGTIVEPSDSLAETYATGRGSIRLRAKWGVEDLGRGQWQIVVTEIPYGVQKSKLIERLAELVTARKVPALADVRDESAADIRIVLEPRARTVEPEMLMSMLWRQSDLENRFAVNMNVLIDGVTPRICSLRDLLRAFLDHRREVLLRRSRHRLDKIDHRLEVLEGFITAFLNLDRVIDIIRYDADPRAALMAEDWSRKTPRAADEASYVSPLSLDAAGDGLSEVQAEAILNMRLRSLRRLEEMELLREQDELLRERATLEDLLDSEKRQWKAIAGELEATRKAFGTDAPGGARRTTFGEAGEEREVPLDALIEREPVTVICSEMGWVRAMKGHLAPEAEVRFKDGDRGLFRFHAETTDRIIVMGSDGRFHTITAASLPGGRGMGEPLRLMVDLPNEAQVVAMFVHQPGARRLVASSTGDGFVVAEDDLLAQTRAGKQVLNLGKGAVARACVPVAGDHAAVVGENRKLLVFPLADLPEMTRGKGVRLQSYKDGGLSDVAVIALAGGLSWHDPAGRTRTETDLAEWLGKRAGSGRMAPRGFPRDNRFN
ncbi:MAG: DNA topoisomerase IV subunit A [Rubellimicrobium sp.]|nr:DNA topoisomerase IV subunit A [Rubellimicrobium sp.]